MTETNNQRQARLSRNNGDEETARRHERMEREERERREEQEARD